MPTASPHPSLQPQPIPDQLPASPPTSRPCTESTEHDATLSIPGLEKHGRRQHPPCCPSRVTDARRDSSGTPPSRHRCPACRRQYRLYIHRTVCHTNAHDNKAGRGQALLSHPSAHLLASSCLLSTHPMLSFSPHRFKCTQIWVSGISLISSFPPHPQFPEGTCKIPFVGEKVYPSCLDIGSCDEDGLEHSCRGSQLPNAPLPSSPPPPPLPLPCSSLPLPPDQAVGSSSGSRDSPPPPPPSRALRFFDISAQGWGLGVSFPTPSPPPPERRVKVGLGGGEREAEERGGEERRRKAMHGKGLLLKEGKAL